jgi:hypothetical protein
MSACLLARQIPSGLRWCYFASRNKVQNLSLAAAAWCAIGQVGAQTVSTVRDAEFRSRWTNYQVDRTRDTADAANEPTSNADFIARFTRFGPLEIHGGLSTGWEYSNEQYQNIDQANPSDTSFFIAPSLLLTYEKELGTWDLSARYSIGWLYYLDPNYRASNGDISTSQTANLSLLRVNDRITIRSTTNASSGTGFDIERSQSTDRITASESFSVEYQSTDYIRVGVSGNYSYDSFSVPGNLANSQGSPDNSTQRYAGSLYLDNFWTDKTAYRFELSAGGDTQKIGSATGNERTFAQGILRVNYGATSKIAFTLSAGLGVRNESQNTGNSNDGLRAVYSLTTVYTPSEKTSIRLFLGTEGSSSQPELTLALNWHPREKTFFDLSIYQQTGLATFEASNERLSRGILATFRQGFFSRFDTSLSAGYEQNASIVDGSVGDSNDPYTFVALALGWKINDYLNWQTQLRTSSRKNSAGNTSNSQQNRASMSLSLTF